MSREKDLIGDGDLIFPYGPRNGRFGRAVLDPRLDNLPFVKSQVGIVMQSLRFHNHYLRAAARFGLPLIMKSGFLSCIPLPDFSARLISSRLHLLWNFLLQFTKRGLAEK